MYQALLKKQPGKAYIVEGKCWDDSENDEESTMYANLALMANQDKASASTSQVSIICSIKISPGISCHFVYFRVLCTLIRTRKRH